MLSKGVHRCDVVSLLFVSPDAKKIKYFPKGVEGPLKKYIFAVPFNAECLI